MDIAAPTRRPRRQVWFPETSDPDVELTAATIDRRFDVRLRYGEDFRADLSDLTRLDLLRPFVRVLWRICQIGGPAGSRSTAKSYVTAVRRFWAFLDDGHPTILRPEQLTPQHVNAFEIWLRDGRHTEISAYQIMARLTGCLRVMHEDRPGAISVVLLERLRHVASRYYGKARPRDAYSETVTAAMREAARREVLAIHHRIAVAGEAVLRDGPAEGDAETRAAYRMVTDRIARDGMIGFSLPAYRYLYWLRRDAGIDNDALIDELHGHVYLCGADLVPFLVLLSLETGIEIECCKALTTACLKNPAAGTVEIEYCKRRARGAEWRRLRVRDGSSGTPGGLIRMLLRLTQSARRWVGTDSLWCYVKRGHLVSGIAHPTAEVLGDFIERNAILDDDGHKPKLILARLRKTHKAEWYRRTNGQMEQFAVGHTAEVAANHYADIPALRPLHEQAVADGFRDALDAALAPRIVLPEAEARMRAAPATSDLPVPPAEVVAFLDGAQDLWLASCGGFYASPFGIKGKPCPVPLGLPGLRQCCHHQPQAAVADRFPGVYGDAARGASSKRLGRQVRPRASPDHGADSAGVSRNRRCRGANHRAEPVRSAVSPAGGGSDMNPAISAVDAAAHEHASRYVHDQDAVLAGLPIRPGIAAASLPLFGATCWDVAPAVFRENARRCHCSVDFGVLVNPAQRVTAKEYLYARLREPEGSLRPRLAPGSIRAVFNRLRRFMSFAEERKGVFDLSLLRQTDLDVWLAHLQTGGARASYQVAALLDLPIDLHEHADRLSQPGFGFTPWRGRSAFQIAGCPPLARENSTPRIPAPVIAAMLSWSLRYIDVFAPNILAARAVLDQLRVRARKIDVHRARGAGPVFVVVAKRLDDYLRDRRAAKRGVPVWPDDAGVFSRLDAVPINYGLIALHLGCNAGDISQNDRNHASVLEAIDELGIEIGGIEPDISIDPLTGAPWRPHRLDQKSLIREEKWLQAACYVVCAYLTGMRDSEVQAMRSGCHSVARSVDGVVERHRIHSTAYKRAGVTGRSEDWITIEPVSRAVAVLEQLTGPTRARRGIDSLWVVLKPGAATKVHLSSEIVRTLNQFRDHLDRAYGAPDTPAIPRGADARPWHFSTRQFRRTVAWHIANRPFGTVAGKIQYKHASIATFEGYGGQSSSGFPGEITRESALGQLDDIIEHYEDFRRGLHPTGPASARLLHEFAHVRDELGDLPGRIADPARLRAMLRHLARTLHVGFLNDCFFEPASALCLPRTPVEERRAPMLSHCSPDRCPNSCIAARHLAPWAASIADGDALLRDTHLSALQREVLQTEQTRKRRLIAPFMTATM